MAIEGARKSRYYCITNNFGFMTTFTQKNYLRPFLPISVVALLPLPLRLLPENQHNQIKIHDWSVHGGGLIYADSAILWPICPFLSGRGPFCPMLT